MIITCPCEKKQFKIDSSLIPQEGRELQCGSCERVWFYKPKNESEAPLTLNENISENKIEPAIKTNEKNLEFKTKDPTRNPLMGWESSSDTYTELKLEFSSKELAINYAKKKKIDFELIEPKKRKTVKKSYADNFLK